MKAAKVVLWRPMYDPAGKALLEQAGHRVVIVDSSDASAVKAELADADALWVMRGGHYGDPARMLRTTARGAAEPGARRPYIGFRVALVPPR